MAERYAEASVSYALREVRAKGGEELAELMAVVHQDFPLGAVVERDGDLVAARQGEV